MGIILSRFRKKKTTIEVLEDLDTKIKEIEQYGQTTEQRHKKIVGTLILYSVILYIITAFVFYFYFFPASLYDQIFYIIPLLIFPILILFTKNMVSWYYKRKISHNREKLITMESEKKKILEEVTETETYKKAKEILLKFAPDQLKMTPLSPQPTMKASSAPETPHRPNPAQVMTTQMPNTGDLRRRIITHQMPSVKIQSSTPSPGIVPVGAAPSPNPQMNVSLHPTAKLISSPVGNYRMPLPRPVLPRERTYLDRVIDYLVGDGPSNRYALICRNCESHNGMALKEEFEYFGFTCCYCNFWNPARKQKPPAPKLPDDIDHHTTLLNASTLKSTSVETPSTTDTDSDIEVVERPETNGETENSTKDEDEEPKLEEDNYNDTKKETVEPMEVEELQS